MPLRLRRWRWTGRHTRRIGRRHHRIHATSRDARRRRDLSHRLLVRDPMLHSLMLRVQGVLYDIANSNDLHFPDDNALRQVELRLVQL